MPVQIGATSPSFADPLSLLSDCHRRIEMFLHVLQAVAERADQPLTEDARKSLATALRYFREAAPKHTADEEESLFPRLRQLKDSDVGIALERLDLLEGDHREAAPLHAIVDRLGEQYLELGVLTSADANQFHEVIEKLTLSYSRHIKIEDEVVFPIAAQLLPNAEQSAVAQEMAERRNIRSTL